MRSFGTAPGPCRRESPDGERYDNMFKRPAKRTALALATAATAAAAALSLTFVTHASAAAPAPHTAQAATALPSVSGSPEGAFTRIADFYGSYIDAVYDGDGK